jgi:hypothetical protein
MRSDNVRFTLLTFRASIGSSFTLSGTKGKNRLADFTFFIESEIFEESVCLVDFNPYCSCVRAEKMELAGYCVYLLLFNGGQLSELRITDGTNCQVS